MGNRSSMERGLRCVHIGYIDDAARDVFGRFDEDEGRTPAMTVSSGISKKYGLPMSAYLDKRLTDQSMAKLSIQGGRNNSVPLSEFEKRLRGLGMEAPTPTLFKRRTDLNGSLGNPFKIGWSRRSTSEEYLDNRRGSWVLEVSLPLHNKMFSAYPMGEVWERTILFGP